VTPAGSCHFNVGRRLVTCDDESGETGRTVATHAEPTATKPASQTNPHVPDAHVAIASAGGVHGVQDVPHESGEPSSTHPALHAW